MPPKRQRPDETNPNLESESESDGNSSNNQSDDDARLKKRLKYTAVLRVQPVQRQGDAGPPQTIHLTIEPDFAPAVDEDNHHNEIIFHIFHDRRCTTTTTVRVDSCAVPADIRPEAIPPPHEPQWVWHLTDEEEGGGQEQIQNQQGLIRQMGDLTAFYHAVDLEAGNMYSSDHINEHQEGDDKDDDPWAAEPGPHIDMAQTRDGGTGTSAAGRGAANQKEEDSWEPSRRQWKKHRRDEIMICALLGLIVTWVNILVVVFIFLYDWWWQSMVLV